MRLWHRLVVAAPIGILVMAAAFDLVGVTARWPAGYAVGYWATLVGIPTALLAAGAGMIDVLRLRQAGVRGVARPGAHAAVMLGALGAFAFALFLRAHPGIPPDPPVLGLQLLAALLLGLGAWLGVRVRRRVA